MSPAVLDTIEHSGILTSMETPSNLEAQPMQGAPSSSGTWVNTAHAIPHTPTREAPLCSLAHPNTSEPIHAAAQRRWAARSIAERLQPLREARHWMAAHPQAFAQAISPNLARSQADTLVAELLPLLDAIRFLERNAQKLLAPRKLGNKHRPIWLSGIRAEMHRDPLGHILVIGPANFPLFLPGVQVAQALVAGNAVTWKPGSGGERVANLVAHVLREAGLPRGILYVTDESIEAAQTALAQRPDKVVFTGSYDTGRQILRTLADTATPATIELSGADAVVVLPSADLALVSKAVAFGLRLNGAHVCMSPRRLIATRETLSALRPLLRDELAKVPPVHLTPRTTETLTELLWQARTAGAQLLPLSLTDPPLEAHQDAAPATTGKPFVPVVVDRATAKMTITRTDIFAPVLSLIEAPSVLHLADLVNDNPYALTVAVFGNPREAQTMAAQLRAGTVLVNDLIAPTADPRVPFGGRGSSGFGATRGSEGLLEMTAAKSVLIRHKGTTRHYDPLSNRDLPLLAGIVGALHGGTFRERWHALKQVVAAGRTRKSPDPR